jgi:hypothetical protein
MIVVFQSLLVIELFVFPSPTIACSHGPRNAHNDSSSRSTELNQTKNGGASDTIAKKKKSGWLQPHPSMENALIWSGVLSLAEFTCALTAIQDDS